MLGFTFFSIWCMQFYTCQFCTCQDTHTSLMHVKNNTHYFCLWHLSEYWNKENERKNHTVCNFLKRSKTNFKINIIFKNSILGCLSCIVEREEGNYKHPSYHPTFQRAILANFPVQFNSNCILFCHWLHCFSKFPGSCFESVMVSL